MSLIIKIRYLEHDTSDLIEKKNLIASDQMIHG